MRRALRAPRVRPATGTFDTQCVLSSTDWAQLRNCLLTPVTVLHTLEKRAPRDSPRGNEVLQDRGGFFRAGLFFFAVSTFSGAPSRSWSAAAVTASSVLT